MTEQAKLEDFSEPEMDKIRNELSEKALYGSDLEAKELFVKLSDNLGEDAEKDVKNEWAEDQEEFVCNSANNVLVHPEDNVVFDSISEAKDYRGDK